MAKETRSAADLDAELAALEAELAALEGEPRKAKAKPAPKRETAPAPSEPAAPVEAPSASEPKRGRFSLPFKRGAKAPEPAPADAAPTAAAPTIAPEPVPAAASAISEAESTPPAPPPSVADAFDLANWREAEGAWVRAVPETPVPVVRRVLDDQGAVVREEPATRRDVDEARGVKAERGIGRLLRRK